MLYVRQLIMKTYCNISKDLSGRSEAAKRLYASLSKKNSSGYISNPISESAVTGICVSGLNRRSRSFFKADKRKHSLDFHIMIRLT